MIVSFISLDLILETIHRWSDYDRTFKEKFITNKKYFVKFFLVIMMDIDYIFFHTNFPETALRIARYLRPCKIILI